MATLDAKPENLDDILQRLLPEDEVNLVAGEYKGQFVINQPITLRGVGKETCIFNIDTSPLIINCAGVKIENLSLARSDGGELVTWEKENTPLLHQVSLRGIIRDSQYKHHHWHLPTSINLGDIPPNSIIEQNWELDIGLPCTIEHNISWLRIKETGFYPGKFNLTLQVNSAEMVAGTILSEKVIFSAINGQKYSVSLVGKIVTIESNRDKVIDNLSGDSSKTQSIIAQNWGSKLSGKVIDNLIRYFGNSGDVQYLSFQEKRSLAEGIITDIFGQNYHTFYIHRQKKGDNYQEEIWDLTLATDRESDNIPPVLIPKNKTIVFRGVLENGNDRALKLISINLLIPEKGRRDDFSLPVSIKLLPNYQHRCHIPESAIASIQKLPFCENFIPTEEQLDAWKIFVDIEERMARERQFCVAFSGHNYGVATRNITFDVKINSATIDGDRKDSLSVDQLWYRLRRAVNDSLKICLTPPYLNDDENGRLLGDIIAIEPKNNTVKIRLALEFIDSLEKGYYQMPSNGFLYYEAAGDIIQVNRKRNALKDLKRGKTQNRYLSQFFFDSSQARSSHDTIKLSTSELLLSTANPNQVKAVEKVLVCPDLILIQGPPGTGKTTVIAEICYQIAKRGGKTLIASQGNLAVDNALSRLIHNPLIRALRKGNASRVEEEGLPFLEDRVIDKWLTDTANSCEERLKTKRNNIKIFRELLTYAENFNRYISLERSYNYQKEPLQKNQVYLEQNIKEISHKIKQYENQVQIKANLQLELNEALNNNSISINNNYPSKELIIFLKDIELQNSDYNAFIKSCQKISNFFGELGYQVPQDNILTTVNYLRKNLSITLLEFQATFTRLKKINEEIINLEKQLQLVHNLEERLNNVESNPHHLKQQNDKLENELIALCDLKVEIDNFIKVINDKIFRAEIQFKTSKLLEGWYLYEIYFSGEKIFNYLMARQEIKIKSNLETNNIKIFRDYQNHLIYNFNILEDIFNALINNKIQNNINIETKYGELVNIEKQIIEKKCDICHNFYLTLQKFLDEKIQVTREELNKFPNLINQHIANAREELKKALRQLETKFYEVNYLINQNIETSNYPPIIGNLLENNLRDLYYSEINRQKFIEFKNQVYMYQNKVLQLQSLYDNLNIQGVFEQVKDAIALKKEYVENQLQSEQKKLNNTQKNLEEIIEKLNNLETDINTQRKWWLSTWELIPIKFKLQASENELFNLEFLEKIQQQFNLWQEELKKEENYVNRYGKLIEDWVNKLENPTPQDAHELKRIYLDNANVIGITCNQASSRRFREEFNDFDVVIIDEVSKCTPPELLMPSLKAKKLVLIGDYRQLPPMLNEDSIEEIAEEMGLNANDLNFFSESLFKIQYESASDSIKQMLTTQYRMHPMIMGAINQFYDNFLECGINNPDQVRNHQFNHELITPNNHLMWIKTPCQQEFFETKLGTSFVNEMEINVIKIFVK